MDVILKNALPLSSTAELFVESVRQNSDAYTKKKTRNICEW